MSTSPLHAGLARLRQTIEIGKTRPIEWRLAQLGEIERMMREHESDFAEALSQDLGKCRFEAGLALRNLRRWTKPQRTGFFPAGRSRVVHEPLGVVLIIAPWNYPVGLLFSPLSGAIAAGNAALLKPSEVTMHTSAVLARVVPEYLDRDAIALVEGGVDETRALLEQRFDHVFYTGNGRVGRVVWRRRRST